MKLRLLSLVLIFTVSLALIPSNANADGIIIPEPPPCNPCPPPECPGLLPCPPPSPMIQLAIRYHRVTVTIQDQVASTRVDQVFFNPNDWAVEGDYIFPLPPGATVSSFILWIDDKPVEGQILEAEQAREKYQEIVSRLRDPALLEYTGYDAVQAHIYPIPPLGERRIALEYSQVLPAENGLVRYLYPLNTEKFSVWPLEEVSISVDLHAGQPIRAVYSPSHTVDVIRESKTHVRIGYENNQVTPDSDFALYYSLGKQEALHLLSFRDPRNEKDPDGFFLLLLAPRPQVSEQTLSKDVLMVLDRSGSMEGEKFHQAQEAIYYILNHLNIEDRFNIIAFSTGLESYADDLRSANEAPDAKQWIEQMGAQGSTDIHRALLQAASLVDPERPTYLIFLTDGLPTEGVVESQKIIEEFQAEAPANLRLFAFGVGYDVDTFLLDSLAQTHHGMTTYVLPEDRIDESVSSFYTKISIPMLTDLELDFGGASVYDLYPSPLPDLFSGSQIVLVGRYRKAGETTIKLKGRINQEVQSFNFPEQAFASRSSPQYPLNTLPRLWATRKVGYLLNQVRLKGPDKETIDQIVRLSIRYGIVTPYTSYLVTEDRLLGESEQERIASQQYDHMMTVPAPSVSGEGAVQKAVDQGALEEAEVPVSPEQQTLGKVRVKGSTTFVYDGEKWVDTDFDPENMRTIKVAFLSEEYFALANSRFELASAFALGQAVVVVSERVAYEVVPEGTSTNPIIVFPINTPESDVKISNRAPRVDPIIPNSYPVTSAPMDYLSNPLLCASILILVVLLGGYLFTRLLCG